MNAQLEVFAVVPPFSGGLKAYTWTKTVDASGSGGQMRKNPLGFDVVYTQAKRNVADNMVSSQKVQSFVGARHGKHADRGVFIIASG